MNKSKTFIVYHRNGDRVIPIEAQLRTTYPAWKDGRPQGIPTVKVVTGKVVAWPELYAGHTGWIAEQIDRTKLAIKQERARRAARKAQAREGQAPVAATTDAA